MTNNEIKYREGINNILLIAPHGVYGDDDNCGTLTSELATRLNCYAVINEHYQRDKADLNNLDDIIFNDELISSYLMPIVEYKKTISEVHGAVLIVHVHGVDDGNINGEDILIGIGLPEQESPDEDIHLPASLSAPKSLAEKLRQLLANNEQHPIKAEITRLKYAARKERTLNQLFTCQNAYDPAVQSIQLEIKKSDFRDTPENIQRTADALSSALAELAGLKPTVEAEVLPAETQPVAEEQGLDTNKIEEAYTTIKNIFVQHYQNAMLEVGQYIIVTFYGGDYDQARKKNYTHHKSLHQLFQRLQQADDAPKKSWLYNAVNLAVDEHDYQSVHAYGNLGYSHKVKLLAIDDPAQKKQLMEETNEKGLTVRQLEKRITELKPPKQKAVGLDYLIQHPDQLADKKNTAAFTVENLSELPEDKIRAFKKTGEAKIRELGRQIQQIYSQIESYETIIQSIGQTKQLKHSSPRELKPVSGTKEWAVATVNCSIGCTNNCLYCYARDEAVNGLRKYVQRKEDWEHPIIRFWALMESFPRYAGTVMFPSTHDITESNLYACLIQLDKLLRVGNKVLIVSKPRLECIKVLCGYLKKYKDQILFRFTIGATHDKILSFWESNAPSYQERKDALDFAFNAEFETSVSVEPMLDSANIDALISELSSYVSHSIWIGKMNEIEKRVEIRDEATQKAVDDIKASQTDDIIKEIYQRHKDNPIIRWKDSIKKIVGLERPTQPGLDI